MSTRPRTRRQAAAGLAAIAAGSFPAACGGGGGDEVDPYARTTTAAPGKPRTVSVPGAGRLTIAVTESAGRRFRYRTPRTVRAGLVQIRLRNDGAVAHKAQLWRIAGGHTVAQALRARRPTPAWLRAAGGVALTEPRATGTTIQHLAPGRYYVAGVGSERGTVAQFRVTGSTASRSLPPAPARLNAYEYGFRATALRAGRTSVDFRNTGDEPHHVYFAPLRAGATLADVREFFTGSKYVGRPPVEEAGTRETVVLGGHQRQLTELDLRAGRYALLCFVRNRAGGPPHTKLGMIDELRVR